MRARRTIPLLSIVLAVLGIQVPLASASHNRAAQLTWASTGQTGEVRFDLTFAARRSYYVPLNVGDTFSDPSLDFGDGSATAPVLTVSAIDLDHDILYAEALVTHQYSGAGPFVAKVDGCCRLQSSSGHINNYDKSFRTQTIVNLQALSSPHSSINPIVDCHPEAVCSFNVVGNDPEGRSLRWRMATSADATSGETFVQPGPPNAPNAATVDPQTGRYTWDARGATVNATGETYYSTQVVIESVDGNGNTVSSAAVDFLIRLTDDAASHVTPGCVDTDDNGSDDNDHDGLCDNWETSGVDADGDGSVDLKLYDVNHDGTVSSVERADPDIKDIFLEIDYMNGLKPDLSALNGVVRAFGRAPEPVRLHYVVDDEIAYHDNVVLSSCDSPCPAGTQTFDSIKDASFGAASERGAANAHDILDAKRFVFHYVVWANGLANKGGTSGEAELPGNDLVVSLGRWEVRGGTPDQQAGTLMHELGHNLGLHHGGGDDITCKPNYLSVMSYTRQVSGAYISRRALDYSRGRLPTLNEHALFESAGVGGPQGSTDLTAFGPTIPREARVDGPIDWNPFGTFPGIESGLVSADINGMGGDCGGFGETLIGFDDWANVQLGFQATADFSDGVHSSLLSQAPEVEYATLAAVSKDGDSDGVLDLDDLCPQVADPAQGDGDHDGVGDACQPEARDDQLKAPGGRVTLAAPGLTANDKVAGAAVKAETVTSANGGRADLGADGSVTYQAPEGFLGADEFSYTLGDDRSSSTAKVKVDVTPEVKAPAPSGGGSAGGGSAGGGGSVGGTGGPGTTAPTPATKAHLHLAKGAVRFNRRTRRLELTLRLDDAAAIKLQIQRRIGRSWRRVSKAKRVTGRAGVNRVKLVLPVAPKGRYRVVIAARTSDGRVARLTVTVPRA